MSAALLEDVAEAARALAGGAEAWAGRVERGTVVDPVPGSGPDPVTVAALLAAARPIARENGWTAAALEGSSGVEGIVLLRGADADAKLDGALTRFASVAGLALEAARLRERVVAVTRTREALLASVAHDLRNPLNTFAMSAGLLRDDLERDDVDAARAVNLITRMDRATMRMQLLIEDLIEAGRIDSRKVDLALREESAAQMIDEAVAAAAKAGDKSAFVSADGIDAAARVFVDRARTLQLLAKVVAFETKATGEGGKILLGVSRDGPSVVFTARALGPDGLPVAPPEEGRGGLAVLIARGLTEIQNGTFRIEPTKALTVVFTLPAAK